MKPTTLPQARDSAMRRPRLLWAELSLVVITGRTMNLTPNSRVMNTEKPPMVALGTREAAQLPIRVNISTAASMTSPLRISRFLFLP